MMDIKAFSAFTMVVLLLSACAGQIPITAINSATTDATAAALPTVTDTAEPIHYTEYVNGSFWLRLASPKDGEIVREPQIVVSGLAPVETVISINDEIFLIGADESFSFPMTLEEGVTLIDLVASSPQGELIELVLSVVYEKN